MSGREPKISVIVPVYKVEPYLRKCLDSIVNQTYRNLQIILVNDGSPDKCGAICDEYAAGDRQIEVVHQENGGLSAARNTGLKLANGDYIGFVDSDDWIELDMYEYLLANALKYQADIAVCGRVERYKTYSVPRNCANVRVLDTEMALELLLRDAEVQNCVWDKLWRRELFDNIRFPVGRTFEDIAVAYKLFAKAEKVVCLPDIKYNYLQRQGSILSDISLSNRINYYLAAKERYDNMAADWPRLEPMLAAQCVGSAVGIWSCYTANLPSEREKFGEKVREIAAFVKEHYKNSRQYVNLGITGRAVLRLTPYAKWWAFALAGLFSRLYKLKHGRRL